MEAVLGTPFSNSIFRFFEKATGNGHFDARESSSYYEALYCPISADSETLAAALMVVFEKTWVTAWDHAIPGTLISGRPENPAYWIPELGMTVDWKDLRLADGEYSLGKRFANHADHLAGALAIPITCSEPVSLVSAMAADIVTAISNSVPLVCGMEWRESYSRLGNLLAEIDDLDLDKFASVLSSGTLLTKGIGAYSDVCGLSVNSSDLSVFAELRDDSSVRKYSNLFVSHLEDAGSTERLFDSVAEARNSSELAQERTNTFSVASSVTGVASLIPGIGTIAGIFSLGLDASARISDQQSHKENWYSLGPEIQRFESEIRLKQYLESRPR
jgi:hypothetical protein